MTKGFPMDAPKPGHLRGHTELPPTYSRRMWREPVQAVMEGQA